jgi:hypothetical protein
MLTRLLTWAGARSFESCGSSGGEAVYCVAVSRLPSKSPNTVAMTFGHVILYDVTEGDRDYKQADGSYSITAEPETFRHELGHVPQWRAYGSGFLWKYLAASSGFECEANASTGTNIGAC